MNLEIFVGIISGIILPITLYVVDRIRYINHKVSNIENRLVKIENDIEWIKKFLNNFKTR